jgi:hypothetical protein
MHRQFRPYRERSRSPPAINDRGRPYESRRDEEYAQPPPSQEKNVLESRDLYAENQPISFSKFVQLIGPDVDPVVADAKYEEYRESFNAKSAQLFFEQYRNAAW